MFGDRPIAGPPGLGIQGGLGLPPVDAAPDEFGVGPLWSPQLTEEGRVFFQPQGALQPPAAQGLVGAAVPPEEEAARLAATPDVVSGAAPVVAPAPEVDVVSGAAPVVAPEPTVAGVPVEPGVLTPEEVEAKKAAGEFPILTSPESFAFGEGERVVIEAERRRLQEEEDRARMEAEAAKVAGAEDIVGFEQERVQLYKDAQARAEEGNRVRSARYQQEMAKMQTDMDEFSKTTIDPNRLYRNPATASKITMGIGALASGFLELRGRGRGNPVLEQMERAIAQDIQAQKATAGIRAKGIGMKGDLFQLGLGVDREERAAEAAAMAIGLGQLSQQIKAREARTISEVGKTNLRATDAQLKIKQGQYNALALSDRNNRNRTQEEHEMKMEGARLANLERKLRMGLARQKARAEAAPSFELPPESAVRQARAKYGPDVKQENIVVSSFLSEPKWIVSQDRASAKEIRVDLDSYSDSLTRMDDAIALIERHPVKVLVPGSDQNLELKSLLQGMIIYGRPKGSGQQSETDAKRMEDVFAAKGGSLWSLTSPKQAAMLIRKQYDKTEKSINVRIDHRDAHTSGVTFKRPKFETIQAEGREKLPSPAQRLREATLEVDFEKEFKRKPRGEESLKRMTPTQRKRAEEKHRTQTFKSRTKEMQSTGKEITKNLGQDPGTPEYEDAFTIYLEIGESVKNNSSRMSSLATKEGKSPGEKEELRFLLEQQKTYRDMSGAYLQHQTGAGGLLKGLEDERRRKFEEAQAKASGRIPIRK